MKFWTGIMMAAAMSLVACSSLPERVDLLEQARFKVQSVDNEPLADEVAGAELRLAHAALAKAEAAYAEGEDLDLIRHDAYRALRHAEIAMQRIETARAEAEIESAEARRNAILLEDREREAAQARALAEARSREAELMAMEATTARAEAEANQREALTAKAEAEAHEREAVSARLEAAQRKTEAEQARETARLAQAEAYESQAEAARARQEAESARLEAAKLEAALIDLKAEETARGLVITLEDVLFDTDGTVVKPGAVQTLHRLAELMESHEERRLLIEGHTDSRGSDEYNQLLSERRADAVRRVLEDAGIDATRIRVAGMGEDYPVANNHTPEGRQQNRRVEIVISDENGQFPDAASDRQVANSGS